MLIYLVTDQKKFSQVEDIEFFNTSQIWGGMFHGEIIIHLSDGVEHFKHGLYDIKHFIQKYGFIISEE